MKILLYNPTKSMCNIYYNKIGGGTQLNLNGPLTQRWPAMDSFMRERQKDVSVVGASFAPTNNQICSTSLFVRKDTGDVLPVIPTTPTLVHITPIRNKNARFMKRKAQGEVIMSDYRVGTAEFLRVARVLPDTTTWPTVVAKQLGWWPANNSTPYGALPAPPAPPSGYTLSGASILISYSWVTKNANRLVLSPDVSTCDFSKFAVETDTELVTSVLADCNNGVYDLLTEVLELPETMQFLADEVKKALVLTGDLEDEARRMRKALPVEKFAKWLSSHWLKGRYALMPIFYSIADISATLEQIGREYAAYRGKSDVLTPFPFPLGPGLECREALEVPHRCMIKARYTTDSLLSDFRRLVNVNIAVSAWELTTLSFVVDWAVNIGDFLAALTGDDGATDSKCCYAVKNTGTYKVFYATEDPALKDVYTSVGLNAYDRRIINPSDHIGLSLGLDMTWKRIIDAFALTTNPAIKRLKALRS